MTARYYASFAVTVNPTNLANEQGRIVEVDDRFGELLDHDDVAEILAENMNVDTRTVHVYHWSRLH